MSTLVITRRTSWWPIGINLLMIWWCTSSDHTLWPVVHWFVYLWSIEAWVIVRTWVVIGWWSSTIKVVLSYWRLPFWRRISVSIVIVTIVHILVDLPVHSPGVITTLSIGGMLLIILWIHIAFIVVWIRRCWTLRRRIWCTVVSVHIRRRPIVLRVRVWRRRVWSWVIMRWFRWRLTRRQSSFVHVSLWGIGATHTVSTYRVSSALLCISATSWRRRSIPLTLITRLPAQIRYRWRTLRSVRISSTWSAIGWLMLRRLWVSHIRITWWRFRSVTSWCWWVVRVLWGLSWWIFITIHIVLSIWSRRQTIPE